MGVLGWEHGDGSMGTGEWEQEHVDGREGTGAQGLHFGDGSIITWRGEGLEIFYHFEFCLTNYPFLSSSFIEKE